jgi:hypothetical protein
MSLFAKCSEETKDIATKTCEYLNSTTHQNCERVTILNWGDMTRLGCPFQRSSDASVVYIGIHLGLPESVI